MEVSIGDVRTFFSNTIIKVDNKLSFVGRIDEHGNEYAVHCYNPKNENFELKVVPFSSFQNVTERLGFVNGERGVCYWTRQTLRQFTIGLGPNNTTVEPIEDHPFDDGLGSFACPSYIATLQGKYPSFAECMKKLQNKDVLAIAFDRQFAVTKAGRIYYRQERVGRVDLKAKSEKEIVFDDKFKYLTVLIGGNYEKNLRSFIKEAKKG